MNVRKFRLTNNSGHSYELLTMRSFLHTPQGLGYKESTIYQRLGERYAVVDPGFQQAAPKGQMFFPEPHSYDKYFEFVQFCQDTPLTLHYKPSEHEYIMHVRLDDIQKTEIGPGRGLECSVSFLGLTQWIRKVRSINEGDEGRGKVYTYTYDYVYGENAVNTVSFESDSFEASPLKLTIFGPCTNPTWQHYVNNELVADGAINATINSGMMMVVDTSALPYSIKEIDTAGNEVLDLYQFSDFGTDRFLLARRGKNRISIAHSQPGALVISVEADLTYASV